MDKPNNTPPLWSEAPPWAMWRAQNKDGYWCFYKDKPFASARLPIWSNKEVLFNNSNFFMSTRGNPNPNWETTLQKRPDNE